MDNDRPEETAGADELPVSTTITPKEEPFVCLRDDFARIDGDPRSVPFLYVPKKFGDERGCFSVSLCDESDSFDSMEDVKWLTHGFLKTVSQVNRSVSSPCVFRGFHAQKAPNCQGKLVECVSDTPIWDIIVDARPDSPTFETFTVFKLTGSNMEKVWVPRGFLHGFLVPKYDVKKVDGELVKFDYTLPAALQYYTDAPYSKEDEVCVSPDILLQIVIGKYMEAFNKSPNENFTLYGLGKTFADGDLILSEKDRGGEDIQDFIERIGREFIETGKVWYR